MGWLGKITGGGIGMLVGGPIGALFGLALGHVMDERGEALRGSGMGGARLGSDEQRQAAFFTATFAMLGKMAKADGRVSEEEVQIVDRFMRHNLRLDARARRLAVSILNAAKEDPTPFNAYAEQFGRMFAADPTIRHTFYELLFALAMADGTLHPAEEALLREAIRPLGLPEAFYERLRGSGSTPDLAHHYRVLGLPEGAGEEDVKKAYRKAARDFHPDTIVAKGLPEEFTLFAEEKFKEIQTAYETITARRRRG